MDRNCENLIFTVRWTKCVWKSLRHCIIRRALGRARTSDNGRAIRRSPAAVADDNLWENPPARGSVTVPNLTDPTLRLRNLSSFGHLPNARKPTAGNCVARNNPEHSTGRKTAKTLEWQHHRMDSLVGWCLTSLSTQTGYIVPYQYELYRVGPETRKTHNKTIKTIH